MPSPEQQAIVDMIRSMPPIVDLPVDEQRLAAAAFGAMSTPVDGLQHRPVLADGVPCEWVWVEGGAGGAGPIHEDRVLMYVHGGGYVIGSAEIYRNFCGHLARELGCRVLDVDYRLAPEHPHPAAVDDATTAYRWLLHQGVQPGHIAVAGDSAGGGLTIATALALRDAGTPLPAALVPLSPWVDLEGTGESMQSRAELDPIVQGEGLKRMADHFLAGGDPRDPLAAPLHADPAGLPPMLIQVGDWETLLDDAVRFDAKARAAGVDVTLEVWPECIHVWQLGCGNVPEATEAVARIGAWLRPRLGLG